MLILNGMQGSNGRMIRPWPSYFTGVDLADQGHAISLGHHDAGGRELADFRDSLNPGSVRIEGLLERFVNCVIPVNVNEWQTIQILWRHDVQLLEGVPARQDANRPNQNGFGFDRRILLEPFGKPDIELPS